MKHVLPLPSLLILLASFQAPLDVPAERAGSPPWMVTELDPERTRLELRTTVLEGRVLMPGGGPAQGAMVVSSAGGRAMTDGQGDYRLVLELPLDVREVQVTAVQSGGSSGLVASAPVAVPSTAGSVRPGHLRLDASTTCEPSWLPTFGGFPGMDERVNRLLVHDDGLGGGPALYATGNFRSAGGVEAHLIARWDGTTWSPLGGGLSPDIHGAGAGAMGVFDDGSGSGPALYVSGNFQSAGGVPASHIARWDGTSWSALGSGLNAPVGAMAVYDDGGGPALYVGGGFYQAGGITTGRIARWDGVSWSSLGGIPFPATGGGILALAVHDDGGGHGPALYVGGQFANADGVPVNNIARWDGASWTALAGGVTIDPPNPYEPDPFTRTLAVFDDGTGSGPALYACGFFSHAGGVAAQNLAKWDGATWSPLGSGSSGAVSALTIYDDGAGGGAALYAAGTFPGVGGAPVSRVARWDGAAWEALEGLGAGQYYTLAGYDGGAGGGALYIGGWFAGTTAGGEIFRNIAGWKGAGWEGISQGRLFGKVHALTVHDDGLGGGPALYAAGEFTSAEGVPINRIAKWDGGSWSALGGGSPLPVLAMVVYDDGAGGGPALYAAGWFSLVGGGYTTRIGKWDGTAWSDVGGGVNAGPTSLAVYDDGKGGGPELYVAGHMSSAGGIPANRIAKWNGTAWSPVGDGIAGGVALAMAVFDEGLGAGPVLFVGGDFTWAGGLSANRIARWDGTSWSAVGTGFNSTVHAMLVFDDGNGPALYVGGDFTIAVGMDVKSIVKYDGTSWSPLGAWVSGKILSIASYDDGTGSGPALYVGGSFRNAGGVTALRVARWDGASWSPLGSGIPLTVGYEVAALTVFDDGAGEGPSLIAGGTFTASSAGDSYIARWGGCAIDGPGAAYCFGDGSGTACPCGNQGGAGEGCANSSGMGALLAGTGSASVGADDLVINSTQLPLQQPALLFAGNLAVTGEVLSDGLLCAGGTVVRLSVQHSGPSGSAKWGPGILGGIGFAAPGQTAHFQVWYRDIGASPCGSGSNLTNGYAVTIMP